jgi:hypothetical protein
MSNHFARGRYRDEDRIIGPSLDAIERAYDVLRALPERDSVRFFPVEEHQRTADSGNLEQACQHLFFDAYNWLKFFWWTTCFKTRQLAAALVDSYNNNHLLAWLILGRSSLEYAAVTYHFVKKIGQLQLRGPNFAASQVSGLEELMLQYAHGSRFNWPDLFAGNREGLAKKFTPAASPSAVNVLTALGHLAKRDARYRDVEIAYHMLSDFAHPNMASHASVIEMAAMPNPMHECQVAAQPGPLRGEFIMVVSIPWVSTGIGTTVELLMEIAPTLQAWLAYLEDGISVTVDFTK